MPILSRRSAPLLLALLALAAVALVVATVVRPASTDSDRPSVPAELPSSSAKAIQSTVSPAPPGPNASAAALPREVPPICQKLLAQNERALGGTAGPRQSVSFSTSCYPAPRGGAWGLRLDSWTPAGSWAGVEGWKGQYTIVHIDAAGQEALAEPAWAIEDGVSYSAFDEPQQFDFDGDGEPELFVRQRDKEHEGPMTARAALYSLKKGKIDRYPGTPKDFEDMEDADNDGRPDLIYYPYRDSRTHPVSQFGFTTDGPALLAHSLPDGAFSTSDAAAQAYARKACPSPDVKNRGAEEPDVDPELCALLWGASESKAKELLQSLCPQGERCTGACAEADDDCGYFKDRAALLSLPPPLQLRP